MHDSHPLLHKALGLIATKGWDAFSLADLVEENVTSQEVVRVFETKEDVLKAFSACISAALTQTPFNFEGEEALQGRLFEVMMARFDLLAPYKEASRQILSYFERHPLEGVTFLCLLENEMAALLSLVGEHKSYPPLFTKACLGVYLLSLRTWHEEESPDSEATMSYLHQALGRVCRLYSVS
ncbi:MAG: hypothetical protein ACK5TR_06335 [Alphaproteobacteria bacterium]|jgi:ubiquinone biosynthesis protein COQ9|nr:hypothetical protein [Alphaproteobacteria bacterium]